MTVLEMSTPVCNVYNNDDDIIAVFGTVQREMFEQKSFSPERISSVSVKRFNVKLINRLTRTRFNTASMYYYVIMNKTVCG